MNKDFYINEQIKAQVERCKKQAIKLAFVLGFAVAAVLVAIILILKFVFDTVIPIGYSFPTIMTAVCVTTFGLIIPFTKRINTLRDKQMEEFKDKPIYDKCLELLNCNRKLFKLGGSIVIGLLVLSFIISWTIAILFPYTHLSLVVWLVYLFVTSIANLAFIGKQKEVKALEKEIVKELNNN